MHIPDGFLAPEFYLPAWGAAGGLSGYALHRLRKELNERTLPFAGAFSAASFFVMTLALPLPFGGTIHATGIPLLSLLFGPYTTLLSVAVVLFMQALLLGEGGITALGINVIIMGFIGPLCVRLIYSLLHRYPRTAMAVGSSAGIMMMALCTAVSLSIQPLIGADADGRPLFFPLKWQVVLPAVLIPHLWLAIVESTVTVWVIQALLRTGKHFPGLQSMGQQIDQPEVDR